MSNLPRSVDRAQERRIAERITIKDDYNKMKAYSKAQNATKTLIV